MPLIRSTPEPSALGAGCRAVCAVSASFECALGLVTGGLSLPQRWRWRAGCPWYGQPPRAPKSSAFPPQPCDPLHGLPLEAPNFERASCRTAAAAELSNRGARPGAHLASSFRSSSAAPSRPAGTGGGRAAGAGRRLSSLPRQPGGRCRSRRREPPPPRGSRSARKLARPWSRLPSSGQYRQAGPRPSAGCRWSFEADRRSTTKPLSAAGDAGTCPPRRHRDRPDSGRESTSRPFSAFTIRRRRRSSTRHRDAAMPRTGLVTRRSGSLQRGSSTEPVRARPARLAPTPASTQPCRSPTGGPSPRAGGSLPNRPLICIDFRSASR